MSKKCCSISCQLIIITVTIYGVTCKFEKISSRSMFSSKSVNGVKDVHEKHADNYANDEVNYPERAVGRKFTAYNPNWRSKSRTDFGSGFEPFPKFDDFGGYDSKFKSSRFFGALDIPPSRKFNLNARNRGYDAQSAINSFRERMNAYFQNKMRKVQKQTRYPIEIEEPVEVEDSPGTLVETTEKQGSGSKMAINPGINARMRNYISLYPQYFDDYYLY